ncbi:MAG: N-acetylmuramoyl-L-alanine amidase [Actinobacteria bacterium]|nr:N-acetylmuramoyl-L-alanine amidase [Actinomycetota bacterium]
MAEAPWTLTRRKLLVGGVAAAAALVVGRARAAGGAPAGVGFEGVEVIPRSVWAGGLDATGPIPLEAEVRYLLVHHSVDPGNGYGRDEVAGVLRDFYRLHTAKGWPDIAYNFLVDRFGRVWEGRTGSLEAPVAGDATGGNQGSDQLCCFIGNHQRAEPSAEAFTAMAGLLGALGRRYGIPLGPDATAVFTSRGSNRHPEGAEVTTATIAPHRDMSLTQCPGDFVVARLGELRTVAAGGTAGAPAPAPVPAPPPAADRAQPSTTTAPTTTTASPVEAAPALPAPAGQSGVAAPAATGAGEGPGAGGRDVAAPLAAGAALAAAGSAAATAWARHRSRPAILDLASPGGSAASEGDGDDGGTHDNPVDDERREGAGADQAQQAPHGHEAGHGGGGGAPGEGGGETGR